MIKGVSGVRYKSFSSGQDAEDWIMSGCPYLSKEETVENFVSTIDHKDFVIFCAGLPSTCEARVLTKDGRSLVKDVLDEVALQELRYSTKISARQNLALPKYISQHEVELVAVYVALLYALIINERVSTIYSSSETIVNYWINHTCKSNNVGTQKLSRAISKLADRFLRRGGEIKLIDKNVNLATVV